MRVAYFIVLFFLSSSVFAFFGKKKNEFEDFPSEVQKLLKDQKSEGSNSIGNKLKKAFSKGPTAFVRLADFMYASSPLPKGAVRKPVSETLNPKEVKINVGQIVVGINSMRMPRSPDEILALYNLTHVREKEVRNAARKKLKIFIQGENSVDIYADHPKAADAIAKIAFDLNSDGTSFVGENGGENNLERGAPGTYSQYDFGNFGVISPKPMSAEQAEVFDNMPPAEKERTYGWDGSTRHQGLGGVR